jgi:hypothetical protein
MSMDYSESYFYNIEDELSSFPIYCYNRYRINGISDKIFITESEILNYIKEKLVKHKNMRYITLELPNYTLKVYGRDIDFIFNYIKKYYMEII